MRGSPFPSGYQASNGIASRCPCANSDIPPDVKFIASNIDLDGSEACRLASGGIYPALRAGIPHPTMRKSIIYIIGLPIVLCYIYFVIVFHRASRFEKIGKPQDGYAQLEVAKNFVKASESPGFSGNTPNAVEFAGQFSQSMRISQQKPSILEHFSTYCYQRGDSAAIVVCMPELSYGTADDILGIETSSWTVATVYALTKHPEVTQLAIGILGSRGYISILIGEANSREPFKVNIDNKSNSLLDDNLYPFFGK